jgi:hypothetical protein
MSSRLPGGLVAIALFAAVASNNHCAVRVGDGGPPSNADPPSACARVGDETKLAFGAGSTSFAFAWDKDHYVVVFSDPAHGSGDIYAARMDRNGSLLGPPLAVESTPAVSDLPSLTVTSSGYLVVWQEGSAGKAVYAHALGPDASPKGAGVSIAATQADQSRPVVRSSPGGDPIVVWMDSIDGQGDVWLAVVDPSSLAVTAPQRIAPADADAWPWVAGNATSAGMVWSDMTSSTYSMRFASFDATRRTLSPPLSLRGNAKNNAQLARMITTSQGFLAAWEDVGDDGNQIRMALLLPNGNQYAGGVVEEPNSGDANWPNLAWTGSATGIVYYQWRGSRPQIFMSFVTTAGVRVGGLHDLQVSNGSSGWSRFPDVVWTGTEFGVMYVDTRDGPPALWFQRVACHG